MTKHYLKTWPNYFDAVVDGTKTFEVRINDRDYKVGDVLHLQEYNLGRDAPYTGRSIEVIVTYLLEHESWALQPRMVVMAIKLTEGTKLRLLKATSTDPEYLEELAQAADRALFKSVEEVA
jgi:hypothetical protein